MKRRTVKAKERATKRETRTLAPPNEVAAEPSADAIEKAAREARLAELAKQLKERYGAEFEVTSEEIRIWFANGQMLRVGADIVEYDFPVLLINGTRIEE